MVDEWKTIRVPKDVYDEAKARKEEYDVTWGQYVNPHVWHSVFDEPTETPGEEIAVKDDLMDRLDRIEDAAREATNAAQNAERAAEELAGQR